MKKTHTPLTHAFALGLLLFFMASSFSQKLWAVEAPTPSDADRAVLGISSYQLGTIKDGAWRVQTPSGEAKGILINTKAFATDVKGLQGPTPLYVYFDETGVVRSIVVQPNDETPDYFRTARPLLDAYIGHGGSEDDMPTPDAVSGATYSSRSLIANMQAAYKAYDEATHGKNLMGQVGTVMLVLALVIGIVLAFWLRRRKPSCCR